MKKSIIMLSMLGLLVFAGCNSATEEKTESSMETAPAATTETTTK